MGKAKVMSREKSRAFAAVVEFCTGLALTLAPAMVVELLLGANLSSEGRPVARVAGIALLALGLACWPDPARVSSGTAAYRGLLLYNVLVALYLAYLAVVRHLTGLLLWPAVALHAGVALLLIWTWRGEERRTKARAAST